MLRRKWTWYWPTKLSGSPQPLALRSTSGGGPGQRFGTLMSSWISPAATATMKQLSAATAAQPRAFSQERRRFLAGTDFARRSSISRRV
jgi:hypothetical protein